LLNSNEKVLKQIDEWNYNLTIDIGSMYHADISVRTPKEKGYTNYFYDHVSKMYVTYEIKITRNLNSLEQHGKYSNGISIVFDLPLNMFITVIRSDIQRRNKKEI